MEYPNDKMEEFFRNSLDKMGDEPSDKVWQDLDQRLGKEKTGRAWLSWVKYLVPLALLLSSFTFLYYQQAKVLTAYRTQLSETTKENENLKANLQDQPSAASLNSNNSSTGTTAPDTKVSTNYQTIIKRDTVYLYKSAPDYSSPAYHNISELESSLLSSYEKGFAAGLSRQLAQAEVSQKEKTSLADRKSYNALSHLPSGQLSLVNSNALYTAEAAFPNMRLASAKKTNRKRKKKKYKGPIIINKTDPWGKPNFYYKLGPSTTVLSTLKGDYFSSSSLGTGYGLVQELGLTTRFAIQVGAYKISQEYTLSNNGLPLDNREISSYPDQANLESQIVSIEVDNKYLDFPVGVKYDFYQDNLKSFFINPAVKWSLHSPQQFSYVLTDNRLNSFGTGRRFGYLNALSLAVGTEKNINPALSYQVSIGYDLGIEQIGLEQQRLSSLNLKFNLLFGKK